MIGKNKLIAAILGWIIPGAGHWYLGKCGKALFFFLVLTATYISGLIMTGFHTASFHDNQFYAVGNFGSGATLILSMTVSGGIDIKAEHASVSDTGYLYLCVVGLLNAVIVLTLYEPIVYAYAIGILILVINLMQRGP